VTVSGFSSPAVTKNLSLAICPPSREDTDVYDYARGLQTADKAAKNDPLSALG
jgi:hypothetical protein